MFSHPSFVGEEINSAHPPFEKTAQRRASQTIHDPLHGGLFVVRLPLSGESGLRRLMARRGAYSHIGKNLLERGDIVGWDGRNLVGGTNGWTAKRSMA